MSEHPNLRLLLGGYLHQDWGAEHSAPEDAVRLFGESEPAGTVRATIHELEALIRASNDSDDTVLWEVLQEAGSYFDPRSSARSVRVWLTDVHRILTEMLPREG
jgi:hypothetical protein